MDPSIQNLKGKILEKPQKHRWSINKGDNKEEWKYTVEHEEEDWTPYNSNLQMQGIKVGSNIFFPHYNIFPVSNYRYSLKEVSF